MHKTIKQNFIMIPTPPLNPHSKTKSLYEYQVSNYAQSEILDICICVVHRQMSYHTNMSAMDISPQFPSSYVYNNGCEENVVYVSPSLVRPSYPHVITPREETWHKGETFMAGHPTRKEAKSGECLL